MNENEILRLVGKLTQLTVQGEIKWQEGIIIPDELTSGTNNRVPVFFTTKYKEQHIAVTVVRSQGYDGDREIYYWYESHHLAFIGWSGKLQWLSPPNISGMESLIEVARGSVHDVNGIIRNLLD